MKNSLIFLYKEKILKDIPCAPSIVAFTVDKIFNCVPIVGIRSQT